MEPQVIMRRGTTKELANLKFSDGLLSFLTDKGVIYMDYTDNNGSHRKRLYGGALKFGKYTYDGTEDVNVAIYNGETD